MDQQSPASTRAIERPAPARPEPSTARTAAFPNAAPAARTGLHVLVDLPRGRFVYASCTTCGWQGPARRAHASTARDGELHQLVT